MRTLIFITIAAIKYARGQETPPCVDVSYKQTPYWENIDTCESNFTGWYNESANSNCQPRDLDFNQTVFRVSPGERITIICDKDDWDLNGRSANATSFTFNDTNHNDVVSCYDLENINSTISPQSTATTPIPSSADANSTNSSGANSPIATVIKVNVTNVTIDVDHFPTLETDNKFSSHGGHFVVTLIIKANPGFTEEYVTITHNNTLKEEFLFRINGLRHEISLVFKEFTSEDQGQYNVTVPANNLICDSDNVTFPITLSVALAATTLHPGWISAIAFGCLAFLLMVTTIVLGVKTYRKKGREGKPQRLELSSAGGKLATKPTPASNGFHQSPLPSFPGLSERPATSHEHHNPRIHAPSSVGRFSDDEFESDGSDYEKPSGRQTVDSRPPMPLPKEQPRNLPPRSPVAARYPSNANNIPPSSNGVSLPHQHRGLPPPPVSRGPMPPPQRGLPPPPPQSHNQGYRGGHRY